MIIHYKRIFGTKKFSWDFIAIKPMINYFLLGKQRFVTKDIILPQRTSLFFFFTLNSLFLSSQILFIFFYLLIKLISDGFIATIPR